MQILQIFCKEYIFIYIYILKDKIQAIEWQTLNVFQFVVQVQNIWCCRPLCGHHPGRVENFSFLERRTSLCREKLHGHVARTHHHLTMVVVEMGFVLEWMTYDKYGSNGMGERRPFQRDLDRASFGGGEVLIFRAERELKRGRKRWVVRNRDDWKKKKKQSNDEGVSFRRLRVPEWAKTKTSLPSSEATGAMEIVDEDNANRKDKLETTTS